MADPTGQNVALDDVSRALDQNPFWSLRAKAIQGYATLEQSLCGLFAALGDMAPEVAGIIFFKISSADSRNKIIEKLFRRKYQGQYNLFVNSLLSQLRPIDIKRNEIVHWNTAQNIAGASPSDWSLSLVPPNFWQYNENSPSIVIQDLVSFIEKCNFYSRLINMFFLVTHPTHSQSLPAEALAKWLEVFGQPITYPAPPGHPLLSA